MTRKAAADGHHNTGATRIAWLACLAAPLVLLAMLGANARADAQSPAGETLIFTLPELADEAEECVELSEEAEETEEEEEAEEFEEEECESETEAKAGDASPFPPDECLLRTARARVFAYGSQDKVRLVIRYTSLDSAEVTVGYKLKGSKGSMQLGEAKRHFTKHGLFRLTESLNGAQMAKVRAARDFSVQLRIPAAPSFCSHYYSRHLTIKRTVHNQVVWFQSDSIFGTGR